MSAAGDTAAPAAQPHRKLIVGGGAGGLELATRLGDTLRRKGLAHITLIERARTHFWKPHLHEIAAGNTDLHDHATDYLAQSHWHHFRYRVGEMLGLDRARRQVIVGPVQDEDGRIVTPGYRRGDDTLVLAVGSCWWPSSAPGRRGWHWWPSCTRPRAPWPATPWSASTPSTPSSCTSSRSAGASCRPCRSA